MTQHHSFPWTGAGARMPHNAFDIVARELGCLPAALRAVWEVEAAGSGFWSDGSVKRRFEPHHMPRYKNHWTWRDSLNIPSAERERMFREAYAKDPGAALKATSWGGPQIMGFNAEDAGYADAHAMVRAMANDEMEHLKAFARLIRSWRIDGALRALDWHAFALRYNGPGQPGVYARRMEAAFRRWSGRQSAEVLRIGSRGESVARLQRALGLPDDGKFGPMTHKAVEEFQLKAGLRVDGVVGDRTWAELKRIGFEAKTPVKIEPSPQATPSFLDAVLEFLAGLFSPKVT